MRDYDVKIADNPYNFGSKGGLRLGKVSTEPSGGGDGPLQIGTMAIGSLHHGPGQTVQRDPEMYLRGSRVDTSRPGLVLPAGIPFAIYTGIADVFDGIHGATFFEVDGVLKLVTPKAVFDIDNTETVSVEGGDAVLTGNESYTGSVARWRGKVVLGVETDATGGDIIGGDSTSRSEGGDGADGAPVIYDVAADSFTQLVTPGTWEYPCRIVSNRNTLWWVQNHGKYGAPELYWTDDASTDFGSITEANTFGPFTIPMGGYCTALHMAGPNILVFKRDGTIVGVDEQKIWTPYTPERGFLEDDLFGHGVQQYLDWVVVPDSSGSLLFQPSQLSITSIEPSFIQGYPAYTNDYFMGRATVFAVRDTSLYAFGNTKDNSITMYEGKKFVDGSFSYASDYGIFASPAVVAGVGGEAFTVQDSTEAEGSTLRPSDPADAQQIRTPVASTVTDEEPVAAHVSRHTHGGTEHYHMYVATRRTTDDYVKIYTIQIPTPGYKSGPNTLDTVSRLITSKLWGSGSDSGLTKIPLQVRGYLDTTAIVGSGTPSVIFTLGLDEASPQTVGITQSTGIFSLPMPAPLNTSAGRALTLDMWMATGAGWRLELPLFVDYLISPDSGVGDDFVTLTLTLGEVGNLKSIKHQEMTNEDVDTMLALKHTSVSLEFHWGATWTCWVESVDIVEATPNRGGPDLDGVYVVRLTLRRLA